MKSLHPRIHLRRGLFRLWIVATFAWVVYWGWYFAQCNSTHEKGITEYFPITCPGHPWHTYGSTEFYGVIASAIIAPAIALLGGYVIVLIIIWIFRGFQRDPQ
jgi:hypothetical protein